MKLETAQKAAKWWADQLRDTAPLDNGDTSFNGAMLSVMAMMLQSVEKAKQTTDQIDAFERELANVIEQQDDQYYVSVSVDYHPDRILQCAAQKAGINLGMTTLPWKTSMSIKQDVVMVSCGYGAPTVTLP